MPTKADRSRFRQLYGQLHPDLWRYCARRVRPAEDAEDLLAEVFAVVWRRLEDVPAPPGERAWVFAVARNHVRDRARRLARRERLGVLTPEVVAYEEPPQVAALRHALDQLKADDAEVIRLAVWDELTHREIAVVLGCREGAVAVRLHRAKKRLAALLDDPALTTTRPPKVRRLSGERS